MARDGMTLLELMIALAILSLILVASVPIGTKYWDKLRIREARSALIHLLGLGRVHALSEGSDLILCGSVDGEHCRSGEWSSGFLLKNRENSEVIYAWASRSPRLKIAWAGMNPHQQLTISPYLSEQMLSGHFTLSSGSEAEKLILNRIGRWRVVPLETRR